MTPTGVGLQFLLTVFQQIWREIKCDHPNYCNEKVAVSPGVEKLTKIFGVTSNKRLWWVWSWELYANLLQKTCVMGRPLMPEFSLNYKKCNMMAPYWVFKVTPCCPMLVQLWVWPSFWKLWSHDHRESGNGWLFWHVNHINQYPQGDEECLDFLRNIMSLCSPEADWKTKILFKVTPSY